MFGIGQTTRSEHPLQFLKISRGERFIRSQFVNDQIILVLP